MTSNGQQHVQQVAYIPVQPMVMQQQGYNMAKY